MKRYVKNSDEDDYKTLEFDKEAIQKAYAKRKQMKKYPTSINLPEDVIVELKDIAHKKGIPYQTLMRSFILEGLKKMKKAA